MINPTRIDLQNNYNRIIEILRHSNRLDTTVSKHTQKKKIKRYSSRKESKKFVNQFNIKPKEIDIKDKAIEAAKNIF